MTTENVVETTTVTVPSKIAFLKSKVTKEVLIVGGIVTGIIIAGGLAVLKSDSSETDDESSDLDEPPFEPDIAIQS